MVSATGPIGGPLPDCGMASTRQNSVAPSAGGFPGAPQATGQAASDAGAVSFADAFAAIVAELGGSQPAGADATALNDGVPEDAALNGAALPAADTPLDPTRAGDAEQDSASEDLEAEFVVSPTAPLQRDVLPFGVLMTLPTLPDQAAAAADAESGSSVRQPDLPGPPKGGQYAPSPVATPGIPNDAEAPVSAPAPDGQPIAREIFSPAESPAPVDLPDDGHADASRKTFDPAAAAREVARTVAPASVPASEGAPAAGTPAAEARSAGPRVPADLVASVQTDAPAAETASSGAALADGEGGNAGSSGSPNSDPEESYIAPTGPPGRFGRIEDMVRELDRQAGESPASSRPVTAESRVAGPRVATPAAIAQPPAPAPAPADVPRENVAALAQGIRIQLRQGISEATVRLQPEHFGEVTIAVRLEKGVVSAQVHAEASGVCDWLAGQEESIRSNLSEHGLQLDRFVVQRDRPRERRETPQQPNRPRARQEPDAEQPRFEVAA